MCAECGDSSVEAIHALVMLYVFDHFRVVHQNRRNILLRLFPGNFGSTTQKNRVLDLEVRDIYPCISISYSYQ
jgi:hypothetical protein